MERREGWDESHFAWKLFFRRPLAGGKQEIG